MNKLPQEKVEQIIDLIKTKSISEVAHIVGCGVVTVSNVIRKYGITRTREEHSLIRSNAKIENIRAEKRRVLFGLEQKTNLKVFTNKERNTLKYCLKRKKYIFIKRGHNIAYYDKSTIRNADYEEIGRKLGLRFLPYTSIKL